MALQIHRHVANLIEEQRAAIGMLDLPLCPGGGAGERAFFVAEQLGGNEQCEGKAAQFTATNGPSRRGERS